MNRYLLNISYIGTRFRGIQKTVNKFDEPRLDTTTIQGCIELALGVLRPVNEIQTVLSSRTDAGVHALHSTIHVDLQSYDLQPYFPATVTGVLNRTLDKHKLPIRIKSVQLVPNTFHCRYSAKRRTYLYRIAVAKGKLSDGESLRNKNYENFIPIEEIDRCFFLQDANFDIEKLKSTSQLFLGRHDFRSFMSVMRKNSRDHPMFTVRSISDINIKPGRSLSIGSNAEKAEEFYNYWNIEITAKSFLYKQVRRMIGSLLAVACGRLDEKVIYEMLTIPSKNSWDGRILLSPALGLYLCKVHYDEADLKIES